MTSQRQDVLVGRDSELKTLRAVAEGARGGEAAVAIVQGRPGMGKSALLAAAFGGSVLRGWALLTARCYEGQEKTPAATLDQLLASGLADLSGPQRDRYVGGLRDALAAAGPNTARVLGAGPTTTPLTPEQIDRACSRLVAGLILDIPVAIIVDDIQWADSQSSTTIANLLNRHRVMPMLLVIAGREVAHSQLADLSPRHDIVLTSLPDSATAEIVRYHYGEAAPEVVEAIVGYARGVPLYAELFAKQAGADRAMHKEEISRSIEVIYQRDLAAMSAKRRELLHICALLQPPIEYRILRELFDNDLELAEALSSLIGRYLVADGASLRFVHDLVAEAVRSSIDLPAYTHGRILTALDLVSDESVSHLSRLVCHARASGDVEREYRALLSLGRLALSSASYGVAAGAYERALSIRLPDVENHVEFFNEYGQAVRMQGKYAEAQEIVEKGIRIGRERGLKSGFGILAASLIAGAAASQDHGLAEMIYRELGTAISDSSEKLDFDSAMGIVLASIMDVEGYGTIERRLEESAESLSDFASANLWIARSIVSARCSSYSEGERYLQAAALRADTARSMQGLGIEILLTALMLYARGVAAARARISDLLKKYGPSIASALTALSVVADFVSGDWGDLSEELSEELSSNPAAAQQPDMLAVSTALSAVSGVVPLHRDMVSRVLEQARGREQVAVIQLLGSWWCAAEYRSSPQEASALARQIVAFLDRHTPFLLPFAASYPVALAIFGERAGEESVLRPLADGVGARGNSLWERAFWGAARGMAARALGLAHADSYLKESCNMLDELGAHAFSALVRDGVDPNARKARKAGRRALSRATRREAGGGAQRSVLSRRELEVVDLVVGGATNREIAARLFLSERTVEAHLGNIYRKAEVGTRTQLTRWYLLQQ